MATFDRYNQFTIPEVAFAGSIEEPKSVTFDAPDTNILARSLQLNEERQNRSITANAEFDKAFGDVAKFLPQDDADTQQWLKQKKDAIYARIQERVRVGDYAKAYEIATQAAGALTNDPEFMARAEDWKRYQKWEEEIKTRTDIDDLTKNRAIALNPYSFRGKYSSDQQNIDESIYEEGVLSSTNNVQNNTFIGYDKFEGTKGFETTYGPVKSIKWDEAFSYVLGIARERTTSRSSSNKTGGSHSYQNAFGGSSSSSSEHQSASGNEIKDLPEGAIMEGIYEYARNNIEGIEQDIANAKWMINNLTNAIQNTTSEAEKNRLKEKLAIYSKYFDANGNIQPVRVPVYDYNKRGFVQEIGANGKATGKYQYKTLNAYEAWAYMHTHDNAVNAIRHDVTTSSTVVNVYNSSGSANDQGKIDAHAAYLEAKTEENPEHSTSSTSVGTGEQSGNNNRGGNSRDGVN